MAAERQTVASFFADLAAPRRHRDHKNVDFALDVLGIRDLPM